MRRVLSVSIGFIAAALLALGGYTLAVADKPQYEGTESYGGLVLILGLALAAVAWMAYPRGD